MKTQSLTKLLLATALVIRAGASAADYWPQFRGPNGSGISDSAKPPVHFGPARTNSGTSKSRPDLLRRAYGRTRSFSPRSMTVNFPSSRWIGSPASSAGESPSHRHHRKISSHGGQPGGEHMRDGWPQCCLLFRFVRSDLPRLQRQGTLAIGTSHSAAGGDFGSGASPIIVGDLVLVNRDQAKGSELMSPSISRLAKSHERADRADPEFRLLDPRHLERQGHGRSRPPPVTRNCGLTISRPATEIWRVAGCPPRPAQRRWWADAVVVFAGRSQAGEGRAHATLFRQAA